MADYCQVQLVSSRTVRELHIDFLLEEEFHSNPSFLREFISAAGREGHSATVFSVRRSVTDSFGEADLIVVYTNPSGQRTAILIEDKVRAAFQPGQPERYRMRGEAGLEGREWDSFWTCLVAPRSYIGRGHDFQTHVDLEAIIETPRYGRSAAIRV